jgi:hypothetical protein
VLPPEVVDICQPCELIVEPLTVGAVEFNEPPEHNAAGVEIAAIVGLAGCALSTTSAEAGEPQHLEITAIVE